MSALFPLFSLLPAVLTVGSLTFATYSILVD
jgi:hypothetical protein